MEKLGAVLPSGAMSPGFSGAFLEKCEKRKNRKIRRCYIIWRSCKMIAPGCLRSVRMKRSKSRRSFMKKTDDLSENGCSCFIQRSCKGNP